MGQEYRIDRQRRFVFSAGYGEMTLADFLAHHRRLVKDPDFDPSFHLMIDLTGVKQCSLTPEDIKLVGARSIFSDESRRALLVGRKAAAALSKSLQYYREALGRAMPLQVFDDFDAAMEWLLAAEAET